MLTKIILFIVIMFFISEPNIVNAETFEKIEYATISDTIIKKSIFENNGTPVIPLYLLAGKNGNQSYISDFSVNVIDIPTSDYAQRITINSVVVKMLAHFAENSTEKYYVTLSICTDDFPTLDMDSLHFDSSGPFTTHGFFSTQKCHRSSPQDSVVVSWKELPKEYTWDVTNLASDLIQYEHARELKFVITAIPVDRPINYYTMISSNERGLVGFMPEAPPLDIGENVSPQVIVTYTSDPSTFMQYIIFTQSNIIPIIALVAPIIAYFIKRRYDKLNSVKIICQMLLDDVKSIKSAFENKNKTFEVVEYNTSEGKHVKYTQTIVDTDAYDSAMASKQYPDLELDIRKILSVFFGYVKDHSELQKKISDLKDEITISHGRIEESMRSTIIQPYEESLTRIESESTKLILGIETMLQKKLKKGLFSRITMRFRNLIGKLRKKRVLN